MFALTGTLRYDIMSGYGHRLVVDVERDIARFYAALVPRSVGIRSQRYAPHVTVVRLETPSMMSAWGMRQGQRVSMWYDPYVYNDERYYWLRVHSDELLDVRKELGLPSSSRLSRPPDGVECFHMTIGNTKP